MRWLGNWFGGWFSGWFGQAEEPEPPEPPEPEPENFWRFKQAKPVFVFGSADCYCSIIISAAGSVSVGSEVALYAIALIDSSGIVSATGSAGGSAVARMQSSGVVALSGVADPMFRFACECSTEMKIEASIVSTPVGLAGRTSGAMDVKKVNQARLMAILMLCE